MRIRKNISGEQFFARFSSPPPRDGELCRGQIVRLTPPCRYCYAEVGDTYAKIAAREGLDEKELAALNRGAALYPTKRIILPSQNTAR